MKIIHNFIFIIFVIVFTKFYEFKYTDKIFSKLIYLNYFILTIIYITGNKSTNKIYTKSINLIISSIFIAIISATIFWKQSIIHSTLAISIYSYFLLYNYLIKYKISKSTVEKTILTFTNIGIILYFYQYLFTTEPLFGLKEELTEDRGVLRIIFPGEGFMFFGLFYYLNRFSNKIKLTNIITFVLLLIMMITQVTRIYIIGFSLILFFHIVRDYKMYIKIILLITTTLIISFLYTISDNEIVNNLKAASENDLELKEDYIRVRAAMFFLNDFSKNNFTNIFGNGAYYYKSEYGLYILKLNSNEQFYLDDLGILKGYILFGIIFIIGYLQMFYQTFKIKFNKYNLYLKYYIWLIIILSVTTRANTNAGFGVVLVCTLYLIELKNENETKTNNKIHRL